MKSITAIIATIAIAGCFGEPHSYSEERDAIFNQIARSKECSTLDAREYAAFYALRSTEPLDDLCHNLSVLKELDEFESKTPIGMNLQETCELHDNYQTQIIREQLRTRDMLESECPGWQKQRATQRAKMDGVSGW